MTDYERDDLVVDVADALTRDQPVSWDRCERLATPANRWVLGNLRAFSRIFAGGRSGAGDGWGVGAGSEPALYGGRLVRAGVYALVTYAAVQTAATVGLFWWGWDELYRASGELQVFVSILLVGHAATACLIFIGGRRDRRTRLLGTYFLLKATLVTPLPTLGVLRGLPPVEPFGYPNFGEPYVFPFVFAPAFLWAFARECPRLRRRTRLDDLASRMVGVSVAVGFVSWAWAVGWLALARAGYVDATAYWLSFDGGIAFLDLLAVAAVVVVVLRAHGARADEARRVALFGCGFLLALGLGALHDAAQVASPGGWLTDFRWTPAVVAVNLLRFPGIVLLWYSVLAARVPHVREAIRATGRRLLLRGRPLALMAAALTMALGWLVASRPERPVGAVLGDPLVQSLAVAVGGLALAMAVRERILAGLDAWLFPEAGDQRRAVANTAAALAGAEETTAVRRTVSRSARRGCGSPAVLLVAADGGPAAGHFVAPDDETAPLARASAIVHVLERSGGSLRVHPDDETSLFPLLPPVDAAWVVETGADAVVAVPGPGAELLGVLVVGRRLDGRVVRGVDVPFLEALGAAAGLAVARLRLMRAPGARLGEAPPAWECPVCHCVTEAVEPPGCGCGPDYVEAEAPKLLAGKYRLTRALGRGGMGVVYLARDLRLERDVAVKTLKGMSVEGLMGLKPEAWAMATVTHPAVAQIHGVESWRGRPFLVVEYLAAGTVADRLAHGPLPAARAASVAAVLADALAALHETGYLHGDVKPSNVGLTADGSPKLLDFGLARTAHDDGARGGTLRYLSPEALSGRAAEAADDVWSLCVVLYEMATGEHPFAGGGVKEVAGRIRRRRLAAPARPRSGAGSRSASVLAFAASVLTAPRPARPATARAFADALRGLLPAAGPGAPRERG